MDALHLRRWLLLAAAAVPAVMADGFGIIGFGKTMYQPPCAFACRSVLGRSTLLCTPTGHTSPPPKTPPSCFASDPAFLQTLALCIDTYCPDSDAPRVGVLEEYWDAHVAAGSPGTLAWLPAMTYQDALRHARSEERDGAGSTAAGIDHSGHVRRVIYVRHGGHGEEEEQDTTPVNTTLPVVKPGAPLNATSFIRRSDWLKNYNGLKAFELNEIGHSKYTIIVTIVPFLLALAASLPRWIPVLLRAPSWAWMNSMLVYPPLWGKKHRQPIALALGGGFMPTRGESLYIGAAVALNVVFLIVPYFTLQPQSIFPTVRQQELSVIGARSGIMAMGNVVALTVFAGRNNPLLSFTGWNHDTYLLFHRVFGYLAIFHTVLHSVLLLAYHVMFGNHAEEVVKPYWIWGIVATLAVVLLWPTSLLTIRKRCYEVFLCVHHILVAVFFIGYFYHIFHRYTFKWGYEVWCYIAGGLWATERLIRVGRMIFIGRRTADITIVPDSECEYLRIDIDGAHSGGLVYLYFPTLSWRFWENHPFSVASSFSVTDVNSGSSTDTESPKGSVSESSNGSVSAEKKHSPEIEAIPVALSRKTTYTPISDHRISILVRVQSGMTLRLAAKVAAGGSRIRLPVIVEGPYHAASVSELSQCTSIICIAGGVGVSAVLPILREHSCRRRLYWGVRNRSLVNECKKDVFALPADVQVETSIGERLDIRSILKEELLSRTGEHGPTGVVVCGPPEMADTVRNEVSSLARSGFLPRGVVLLDEAFTW